MKILILTQSIDQHNPVLSFFHGWIKEFSKKFESIVVICLEKGKYDLPENVKVFSLGKENKKSRLLYLWNFYKYIWQEKKNYDVVFVHMNQEYVLLGWKIWFLLGKKIYMWRNHQDGNFLTDIASFFCKKVFCTSKFSYTAKYKKTVIMPVGINLDIFKSTNLERKSNSILFLGRIALVKRPDLLIEALGQINNISWTLTIVGDPLPKDVSYFEGLKIRCKELGIESRVSFQKSMSNVETPNIYSSHEIFVNLSPNGMYDKTIFEAMACGCIVLVSNKNLIGQINEAFIFKENNLVDLKHKLENILQMKDKKCAGVELGMYVKNKHSLDYLANQISSYISVL